jgi:hypothetical protein
MSISFAHGSGSSRAQTLETITVCTEILGGPQHVEDVLEMLCRIQPRVPGSWVNRPGEKTARFPRLISP